MELNVFQKLTEQITQECYFMTDSQQEEKVIQLIDLHHFIESYNQSLKVIDYIHHPINIIDDNGVQKGILFYDMKHSHALDIYESELFKSHHQIQELWFVFVEEENVSQAEKYMDFIQLNAIDTFYDRIFMFNFFQSTINVIK
ncbi:hypothetical protein NAL32_10410 [Chryseobacterium sp. Ch-15]|uniref:Uncharacterized protein n=1 Tax=Chryseobacterium muglaense TaxID=2893752 RepID=A0A9Q3UUH7_9FLAO|nr:hypothetical protein [Chryseobacterium muglaense]MBD3906165.1 hypothetical protein [Chryseobacterium muglaense]MCC9033721.1 hypothetical protein [Chryseobacterium muglaense]MCM2554796.1 hypothetical protein [Chryseobacterium muglaense]